MADSRLLPAVAALEHGLSELGVRHMLIGGVAIIARGVRRLTDDVDATVWGPDATPEGLLAHLEKHGFQPRIPDAVAFATRSQVLLMQHVPSMVEIDLSLAWLPFEDEALQRATAIQLGETLVPVASPEDLVIYKAIAARERDRSDIERLLAIHGVKMDQGRISKIVRELAAALQRPELHDELEALMGKSKGRSSKRPRRKKLSRS